MTNNNINTDQIEKYLSGQMMEDEKRAFEKEISVNPALQEELALHREVLAGMEMYFEDELKQKLIAVEKEIKDDEQKSSSIRLSWVIGIAASLMLVALSFYFIINQAPSSEEIFISYYEPYPNIISPAERSGEAPATTVTALDYYEQENYLAAIEAFEAQLEETLSQPSFRFYYALSYLSLDKAASAIPHLQELASAGGHNFVHQAQWYLGLAYLKTNQEEKASQIFHQLKNSETPYSNKAEIILEELE